jgi:hypothetical protein
MIDNNVVLCHKILAWLNTAVCMGECYAGVFLWISLVCHACSEITVVVASVRYFWLNVFLALTTHLSMHPILDQVTNHV